MFRDYRKTLPVILLVLMFTGLKALNAAQSGKEARWYSQKQVIEGMTLFRTHCATCHGQNAESTANWRQPGADGHYPPPPLNGSAHTWHHDLPLLQKTVREGGQKLGGLMPPFEKILNANQINSVIAYFQSLWPQDIYQQWARRFNIPSQHSLKSATSIGTIQPEMRYLQQRLGTDDLGEARATPMSGMYRIEFGDKVLYLTQDGQFAFIGDMIDLKNGINLSKQKPD